MVIELKLDSFEDGAARFNIKGVLTAEGGLNPDVLLQELYRKLGREGYSETERIEIEMDREYLLS
jgi:hypothetical protein